MKNKSIVFSICILIALSSCDKDSKNKISDHSHNNLIRSSKKTASVEKSNILPSEKNLSDENLKTIKENSALKNKERSNTLQYKAIGNDSKKHLIKSQYKILVFSGEVRSPKQGKLSFRTSGFISKVHFKSGEFVKKGKVIYELDKTYPLINKNMAKADLKKAQVNFKQSKRDYRRSKNLKNKKAISQESFEISQTDFKNNEVSFKEAKFKYDEMTCKLEDTELKAPYDGIIANKIKSEGEYVTPGESILEFFTNSELEVDIYLPESYLNKIKVGDMVPLYIPSSKKKTKLLIKRIVPYISKQTRTFKIIGGVVSKESGLLSPGLFVEAHFN